MKKKTLYLYRSAIERWLIAVSVLLLSVGRAAADNKAVPNGVPGTIQSLNLKSVGRLPAASRLRLAIGLPMRNKAALTTLVHQMYDPTSPVYHHFLTPAQLTEKFGPTEQDYQAVIQFAQTNGLDVSATYDNRLVLDVAGSVPDIEKCFHVSLLTYQHPTEARQFFAPDREPTVDSGLPILNISGLDNYNVSHPNLRMGSAAGSGSSGTANGTGPGGNYQGYDFRNAYAPGVTLTGAGQTVGLFEEDGYVLSDITTYEANSGISPDVTMQNVLLDGLSGAAVNSNAVSEVSLDIEMAIAMAPGLSKVVVFEGSSWDDILNSMVSSAYIGIKQFSSSWGFSGGEDGTIENDFLTMAAQGQSFYLASGDGDAFTGALMGPDDDPNITTVGGTALTMNGSGGSYNSESVWNWGYDPPAWWYGGGGYWGSGGGISTRNSIPYYQQGVGASPASTTMRNVPDVALTATGIWVIYFGGRHGSFGGTSCAAPLWAGFTALVNQQAASEGQPSVGFINPALYAIASGPSYTSCFNDITSGNNESAGSPSEFTAITGYDLCTGLGTPNGINLINALMPYSGATWVDYNYTGSKQNGTYDYPYQTLAQGVAAVSASGNVWFKTAGSKAETMTITKAMTIHALHGPVNVGN
ncbi:MAG TPA: S53 family peptidase [Verrucomicrobiae bacterium]